jgi:putative transposase
MSIKRKNANANIIHKCRYHVVFCTKYRRRVLVPPIDERLKILIAEIVAKWGQALIELEVRPDHVHLLLGCDPQFGSARLIRYLKGTSSYQLRGEFPELSQKMPALWTNSYFVSTAGGVTLETLKRYVQNQKLAEKVVSKR